MDINYRLFQILPNSDPMANILAKADIIESALDQLSYQKSESTEIIEILIAIIKESLEFGEDVMISGFDKL